jgi:hypothetical protein
MTTCTCPDPALCQRLGRHIRGVLWKHWLTNPVYRAIWEAQALERLAKANQPARDCHGEDEPEPRPGEPPHPLMCPRCLSRRVDGSTSDWPQRWQEWPVARQAYLYAANRFAAHLPAPPASWTGRGIVLVAGGRYWPTAYVTIRAIRHVGCALPIQVWYLGEGEYDERYDRLLAPLGVQLVDADQARATHGCRTWGGWVTKTFAVIHSPFREVLYLDADSYPVRNPSFLFDDPQYLDTGAVFWPDAAGAREWVDPAAFGIQDPGWPPHETGQYLIDKPRVWEPLRLAHWYCEHSDYYFYRRAGHQHGTGYGDTEIFWAAFAKLNRSCTMYHHHPVQVPPQGHLLLGPDQQPLLIHRITDKFVLHPTRFYSPQQGETNAFNRRLPLESFCHLALGELQQALAAVG